MPLNQITTLSLDLDDTLWPVKPTLVRAEQVLNTWLQAHAPATASAVGPQQMLALRAQVAAEHPHWAHDLTAIRQETLRRALASQGEDPALAEPAFEVFFHARHDVQFYADALPALERLAARYRLIALSNGNAELARVGLDRYFTGAVSARAHGRAKPAASIFLATCAAAGAPPTQVLHLGDDLVMDVQGALDAGLHAGWIHRDDHPGRRLPQRPAAPASAHEWADLAAVADALGA